MSKRLHSNPTTAAANGLWNANVETTNAYDATTVSNANAGTVNLPPRLLQNTPIFHFINSFKN